MACPCSGRFDGSVAEHGRWRGGNVRGGRGGASAVGTGSTGLHVATRDERTVECIGFEHAIHEAEAAYRGDRGKPVFPSTNQIAGFTNWFCIPLLDAGRFLSMYPVSMFEKQMRIPDLSNKRLCPNFKLRFLIERNRIYKFNRSFQKD